MGTQSVWELRYSVYLAALKGIFLFVFLSPKTSGEDVCVCVLESCALPWDHPHPFPFIGFLSPNKHYLCTLAACAFGNTFLTSYLEGIAWSDSQLLYVDPIQYES